MVGQVAQVDKDTLRSAIAAAQNVYDNRETQTQQQLDTATSILQDALTAFQGKIIQAGNASALNVTIGNAKTLYENAVEGTGVGQSIVGSKAVFNAAIDAAQLVLDDATNKTQQQLDDANTTLGQAMNTFTNQKVLALTGLTNVTVVENAVDSSNQISLAAGESLALSTSNAAIATVAEGLPAGTIQVTGVATGGPATVTVHVKKDGQVIKVGTFTVTTIVLAPPAEIVSKTLSNLDFSTVQATQAKLVSKPVMVGDFTGNRKDFTIQVQKGGHTDVIPVSIYWKLPSGFSKGLGMGSVVESSIQQFYVDRDIANNDSNYTELMNRPVMATGNYENDTFYIGTFLTGSNAKITVNGADWQYFFESNQAEGIDYDASKNKTFTIGDGTTTTTIQLTSKFETIEDLVVYINSRLTFSGVQVEAQMVNTTQFKLISTVTGGDVIIDGIDQAYLF